MAKGDPAPGWWFVIAALLAVMLGGTIAAVQPADVVPPDEANPQPNPIPRR